ncbi:MAG: phosphatidylserine decarboxylase [Verrucomicrobiales bacterium]|nr:phosphatidylserine decarboxylase [Verrucomicrobiales bacterium]
MTGSNRLESGETVGIDSVVIGEKGDHRRRGEDSREKTFALFGQTVYLSRVNSTKELRYFDRYEGRLKQEGIYGEKPLRWAYETALGRACLEGIIKRPWFSGLYGSWADSRSSVKEVSRFIERFGVDTSEFLNAPGTFRTFNEFFYRKLKPEARPIAPEADSVIFPADGRHFFIPVLSADSHLYAKGQRFDLPKLFGDADLAAQFFGGSAVLSRLCPTDYHRFHFPLAGECGTPRCINGSLYSVNPIALSRQLGYIAENKRRITPVTDTALGTYLFLEIGATNVGSIVDTCEPGQTVRKGDEKGYFRFGGSMVITVFPEGTLAPAPDLREQSAAGIELYARMGDHMGTLLV